MLGKPVIATAYSGNMDFMAKLPESCSVHENMFDDNLTLLQFEKTVVGAQFPWTIPQERSFHKLQRSDSICGSTQFV